MARTEVLFAVPLALLILGCPEEETIVISGTIAVDVFTSRCDPDEGMRELFLETDSDPTIRWDVLCLRDDRDPAWWAIKVSDWDDRADDWWNVWYLDPDLREVRFGETPLPGVADENNPFAPDALPRVAPRNLSEGSYRLEVWAVTDDPFDSTIGEVKFTMVNDP